MKKRIWSVILTLIFCMNLLAPMAASTAYAASERFDVLVEREGWLDYGESITEKFTLSHEADVELVFSDNCRGSFILSVENTDTKEEVFHREDSLYYEDSSTVYGITLDAGNYEVTIETPEDRDFEYEFKVRCFYIEEDIEDKEDIEDEEDEVVYSLSDTEIYLLPGEEYELYLESDSEEVDSSKVEWSTSNSKVAKVTSDGIVTGVGGGTAFINAKFNGITYSCSVEVENIEYYLSVNNISLFEKQTKKLTVTCSNSDYEIPKVKWTTSNSKIATVNADGKITAKAKGKATITAKIGNEKLTCAVTVKAMKLNKTSATVYVKKTQTLKVQGGSGTIKWSTSNKKVATVTSKGVVKGVGKGTAYIYAKRNGKTLKCKVTVKWQPENGIVKTNTYTVKQGSQESEFKYFTFKGKTTVTVTANNTGDEDHLYVVFESDDLYKEYLHAFLDPGKSVKKTFTVNPGKYKLYYSAYDSCKITVKRTTKPQISKTSVKVGKGFTQKLTTVGVINGGKWSSSDKSIATVTSNGVVKGKKKGTCTIKYTLKTGKVLKCKVTVVSPVTCSTSYVSDTAIYNECGIKFTNYTNKKITYIKLNIKQYDNKGSRLYDGPYDWYYVNDTLPANSSDVWEFWVSDDAKKCSAYITKVYFADGSTWTP